MGFQIGATTVWTIDDEFARVSRNEVPGFGGHYFDESGNSVVWLTDVSQQSTAEGWVAELRSRKGLQPGSLIIRRGDYDFAQLKAWRDSLAPFVARNEQVFSLDIDETENRSKSGRGG